MCGDLKAQMFGNDYQESPCLGPDGLPMKTSVCDDIEQSVMRASNIEKQLAVGQVFQYYSKHFGHQQHILHVCIFLAVILPTALSIYKVY